MSSWANPTFQHSGWNWNQSDARLLRPHPRPIHSRLTKLGGTLGGKGGWEWLLETVCCAQGSCSASCCHTSCSISLHLPIPVLSSSAINQFSYSGTKTSWTERQDEQTPSTMMGWGLLNVSKQNHFCKSFLKQSLWKRGTSMAISSSNLVRSARTQEMGFSTYLQRRKRRHRRLTERLWCPSI